MLDILYQRRSIRRYKARKVDPTTVGQLLQAALLSPSSKGLKPLEFVVVDDPDILAELAPAKMGAGHLKGAALAIVILANSAVSDVWVEDGAIAATILHLTAVSLGLGSCWIQIRERDYSPTETAEEYVRKVLAIPDRLKVEAIISFGYPEETKPHHIIDELQFDKVHVNKYFVR